MSDTRIAYGVNCGWWGPIQEVGKTPGPFSLPCCPHCGRLLYEVPDRKAWDKLLLDTEASDYPNYKAHMEWAREANFHFTDYSDLVRAYNEAHQ